MRPFAKSADVKAGDLLEADSGFTCLTAGEHVVVTADPSGELYVPCRDGSHYLDGQLKGGHLVGLWRVA